MRKWCYYETQNSAKPYRFGIEFQSVVRGTGDDVYCSVYEKKGGAWSFLGQKYLEKKENHLECKFQEKNFFLQTADLLKWETLALFASDGEDEMKQRELNCVELPAEEVF